MKRRGIALFLASAALVVWARPAEAQDDRRLGLLIAYPNTAGVQWDVSDRFGVRVDGSYDRHQTTITIDYSRFLPPPGFPIPPPRTSTSTRHFATLGVSPLITVGGTNQLEMYVAPRVGVSISRGPGASVLLSPAGGSVVTATLVIGLPEPEPEPETETAYSVDAGAVLGASYRLGDRFAIFGEGGFRFDRTSWSRSTGELKSNSIGLGAGVGGILYF
jgi:hypothetical protein